MNILVTGGTGTLGRDLVPMLRAQGQAVRVFTRRAPADIPADIPADASAGPGAVRGGLTTGAGLEAAVVGIETVIHAASATTQVTQGRAVDVEGTRRLLTAARQAGVAHVILVSIVGIDDVDYPAAGAFSRSTRPTSRRSSPTSPPTRHPAPSPTSAVLKCAPSRASPARGSRRAGSRNDS